MVEPKAVTDTRRCTQLGPVATVEHVMSALSGLSITDAMIEVEGDEMPGLDGSAKLFVEGIDAAGRTEIGTIHVEGPFARVYEKREGDVVVACGKGEGHFRYLFDSGEHFPGQQDFELFVNPDRYREHIAAARTFAFEHELGWIKDQGLGKGLDESSALLLGPNGFVNAARFEDEPVRHKLLDLIGDLALTGIPLAALNVVAERSGHAANVALAVKLAEHVRLTRD